MKNGGPAFMKDGHMILRVAGAGCIRISTNPNFRCGDIEGFLFETDWSDERFCGGVISRADARKLAKMILRENKK